MTTKLKHTTITIGYDPEFFLITDKGDITTSIEAKIPGSKKSPHDIGNGVFVHPDNVTLEMGGTPYEFHIGESPDGFVKHFTKQLDHTKKWLKEFSNGKIRIASFYNEFDFTKYSNLLENKQARTFGCDPDQDAFDGGNYRNAIEPVFIGDRRFAGGHIHFGYDKDNTEIPVHCLVQLLDVLSRYHMSISGIGIIREQSYGAKGCYREKPYGFEYRTPGNHWTFFNQALPVKMAEILLWCLNNEQKAAAFYNSIDFGVRNYTNTILDIKAWAAQFAYLQTLAKVA